MSTATEDARIKTLMKEALVELLQERRDLFSDAIEDALEDLMLFKAIKEGESSGLASEQEVLKALAGDA